MLDVYKKDLKGRKAIEESILAVFNLKVPNLSSVFLSSLMLYAFLLVG